MKKINIVLSILLVGAVGFFLFALTKKPNIQTSQQQSDNSQIESKWPEKNISENGIETVIQPIDLNSSVWTFSVSMNTHAGSLDDDLTKVVALLDDQGNVFKPSSWEGSPTGGHHRSGILKFQVPTSSPNLITLSIKGEEIKGSLSWDITQKQ